MLNKLFSRFINPSKTDNINSDLLCFKDLLIFQNTGIDITFLDFLVQRKRMFNRTFNWSWNRSIYISILRFPLFWWKLVPRHLKFRLECIEFYRYKKRTLCKIRTLLYDGMEISMVSIIVPTIFPKKMISIMFTTPVILNPTQSRETFSIKVYSTDIIYVTRHYIICYYLTLYRNILTPGILLSESGLLNPAS